MESRETWQHEKDSTALAGSEDGKGSQTTERVQLLEAEKGKKTKFSLEPPGRRAALLTP